MRQKVILKGPVLTRSGYGEQARFALRALQSREDLFDIYIQPLSWGATTWISEQTEERASIDSLIKKTIGFLQQGGKFDMSLQITIPNEFEKMASLGTLPITILQQRQKIKIFGSMFGVPAELSSARDFKYIHPLLPPPLGYKWKLIKSGVWSLLPRDG